MAYRLELTIPSLPSLATAQKRPHWTRVHRETKRWREVVSALVGRQRPAQPLERARITLTRCSSREPDHENMAMAAKPIVDALCTGPGRAQVLVDDRPSVLERVYRWEKAPAGKGKLIVVVEELQ